MIKQGVDSHFRKLTLAKNRVLLKSEFNRSTMDLTRQLSIILPGSRGRPPLNQDLHF